MGESKIASGGPAHELAKSPRTCALPEYSSKVREACRSSTHHGSESNRQLDEPERRPAQSAAWKPRAMRHARVGSRAHGVRRELRENSAFARKAHAKTSAAGRRRADLDVSALAEDRRARQSEPES